MGKRWPVVGRVAIGWVVLGMLVPSLVHADTDPAALALAEAEQLFAAARYDRAVERLAALPAAEHGALVDRALALCHEKLGQAQQAIDAYRRFLKAGGDPAEEAAVRDRLRALEVEVAKNQPPGPPSLATPPAPPTPSARRWTAPIATGAASAAFLVTSFALHVALSGELKCDWYQPCVATCAAADCQQENLQRGLVYASLAVGAVLAVVDVVLWARAAKAAREAKAAPPGPAPQDPKSIARPLVGAL